MAFTLRPLHGQLEFIRFHLVITWDDTYSVGILIDIHMFTFLILPYNYPFFKKKNQPEQNGASFFFFVTISVYELRITERETLEAVLCGLWDLCKTPMIQSSKIA